MYKNELEIDVGRCLLALLKRIKFIILITVIFALIGAGMTLNVGDDKYTAYSTVYAAADGSYVEATNAVTAMNAYLNIAKSYKVSQRAALIMGRADVTAEDVQNSTGVSSSAKNATSVSNFLTSSATILTFYSTATDPELAMEMADAMAESYTLEMSSILNTNSVKILDKAYTYTVSYDAHMEAWKKRAIFAGAGFVLAIALVVLCEIFDTKVRTVRDATIRNNIPVIGMIPYGKE